ncbi:MAG TPA: CHAT domain-containing protein [Pyrinomonadaceae bacterium]|jgi:CHAT domain-containing protein
MFSACQLRKAAVLFLVLGIFISTQAQRALAARLYDDPRVVQWAKDFNAGKREEVIRATEADMKSGTPHAFAAHVWTETHDSVGGLKEALAAVRDETLRRALGALPEITLLYDAGDYKTILSKYPAARAAEIKDVWSLNYLTQSAMAMSSFEDALVYAVLMLRAQPDNFRVAWTLTDLANSDEAIRPKIVSLVKPGGEFAETPGGRFVFAATRFRPEDAQENLIAVEAWIRERPNDARALRYKVGLHNELEQYETAAAAAATASAAYPYPVLWNEEAVALVRSARVEEARKVVARDVGPASLSESERLSSIEQRWADVLIQAGERGRAREVLEAADKRKEWNENAALHNEFAYLEIISKRHAAALPHARKAAALKPDNLIYQLRLIEALQETGKLQEALALYEATDKRFTQKSANLYQRGASLYEAAGRAEDSLKTYERAIAEYPQTGWLQRNVVGILGKANRPQEALSRLRRTFDMDEPGQWELDKLRELHITQAGNEAGGRAQADKELGELRKRFPWLKALWDDAAAQIGGENQNAKKLALWKEAIAANPGRMPYWRSAIYVFVDAERWDEAERMAKEAVTATEQGTRGDRAGALFTHAMMIVHRLRAELLEQAMLEEGLKRFEVYREFSNGANPAAYHQYRAEVLEALGRKYEAAQAMEEAVKLRPDNYTLAFNFVTKYGDELGRGRVMTRFQRYVDRDPYDGQRLSNLVHLRVMWYINPTVALDLLGKIKERAPEKYSTDYESLARERMGDYANRYTAYSQDTDINNSDRYLGWFEHTRLNAMKDPELVVEVNPDKNDPHVYQVTHKDGQVVRRKQHPLSGRPMLIQVGAAKIECEYDDYGDNLMRVADSAGNEIRLTYYPNNTIKTLTTNDGKEITFVYNEAKKPIKIALKGLGEITVTYKPSGEIDKVASSAGRTVAHQVATSFERLLALIQPLGSDTVTNVPELPYSDPAHDKLRDAYEEQLKALLSADKSRPPGAARPTPDNEESVTADSLADEEAEDWRPYAKLRAHPAVASSALAYARYLVAHIDDRRSYEQDARAALEPVVERALRDHAGLTPFAIEAIAEWYKLMTKVRWKGLSADDYKRWSEMRDYLLVQSKVPGQNQTAAQRLYEEVNARPLALLKSAKWLPKSYLNSPGYWNRFTFAQVLPEDMRRTPDVSALLVRRNNEVVAGTANGLVVLRRGFWEWFGFDDRQGRFSPTAPRTGGSRASLILSLAEDRDGKLLVGTADGLIRLDAAYDGEVKRWTAGEDGLPTPRVDLLAAHPQGILVGTKSGLLLLAGERLMSLPAFAGESLTLLRPIEDWQTGEDSEARPVLVGTDAGLYALTASGQRLKLTDRAVTDAVWLAAEKKIYLLRGGDLYGLEWDGSTATGAVRKEPGREFYVQEQQDIVKANRLHGLAALPLDDGAHGLAVLTDRGLSIFHNGHFEHQKLPLADREPGVLRVAGRASRSYMLTTDGIYALERGQTMGDSAGRVYDLLTFDDLGLTFIARGDLGVQVVRHSAAHEGAIQFSSRPAMFLARDPQGRLVVADFYGGVARFEKGATEANDLFTMQPTVAEGWKPGLVTSLLAASDGAVWVAYGASLFRWQDGTLEEFSLFKDDKRFPSRSEMISRVVETYDKRIWVVASDESHLFHRGQKLEGGLLEWTGRGFRRLSIPKESRGWFITSYTKIGDDAAIIGSTAGFVQHRSERFITYKDLKELSYQELLKRQPMLWLGTRGARLGDDTWLFGTAGGVVAHKDGSWFYPDSLNWKLPDDYKFGGHFGVRTVHAIETDRAGHIYAGTDRGLLIYDSGGGDAAGFLVSNHYEREFAFKLAEQKKLQKESEVILDALPQGSQLAQRVKQLRDAGREVDALKAKLAPGLRLVPVTVVKDQAAANAQQNPSRPVDLIEAVGAAEQLALAQALQEKEQALARLLSQLQKENPGLYQLLELKPLDLVALRRELSAEQAVVQYLPTERNLYIQIVTRDGSEIREVNVPSRMLKERSLAAATLLATGPVVHISHLIKPPVVKDRDGELQSHLVWLYDQLLRPVEEELTNRKQVFIVPFGQLSYVPFAALVRATQPKVEYAVERFNFGYLPSMYLFDLVMRGKRSTATGSLVFGDPDGTLQGARAEAEAVHRLLGGDIPPYLGETATYDVLQQRAPQARVLHLATHGRLNRPTPEESWLLLANNRRLSLIEAMTLNLEQTEMVVLSACETGLAAEGLEYATLARAFAHAGAPSIIATLWEVDDTVSGQLMNKFYEHAAREDRFTALAHAQRDILATGDSKLISPSVWAGYIPFGKP